MPLLFGPSEDSAATGADDDAAAATKVADDVGVTVVVQRANTADLLVDNVDEWVSIGWGLICSVSFAPAADVSKVHKVVKLVLNAPLLSRGNWGDGAAPKSIVDMCLQSEAAQEVGDSDGPDGDAAGARDDAMLKPVVMIIPTASLTSKPKNGGRVISYRGQCDKDKSRELYFEFVRSMQSMAADMMDIRGGGGGKTAAPLKKKKAQAPLCPPAELFRSTGYAGRFDTFDLNGMPLTDADSKPVSMSMRKKLEKTLRKHTERWDKQVLQAESGGRANDTDVVGVAKSASLAPASESEPASDVAEVPDFSNDTGTDTRLRVVAGTFGNRQGLKLDASLGPFTHIFTQ